MGIALCTRIECDQGSRSWMSVFLDGDKTTDTLQPFTRNDSHLLKYASSMDWVCKIYPRDTGCSVRHLPHLYPFHLQVV